MNKLKNLISVDIPYIEPINLKSLSNGLKQSNNFPKLESSFEFPPKDIREVINLLLNDKYELVNFFDIARILSKIENESLKEFILNKKVFTLKIESHYKTSEKYIQNLILKTVSKIYIKEGNHCFKDIFLDTFTTKEFVFLKLCIEKRFNIIQKSILNQDIKKVFKYYSIDKIFSTIVLNYQNHLLYNISNNISSNNLELYKNNLLKNDNFNILYQHLESLISIIEKKKNITTDKYIDELILSKLGNIEDSFSNWNKFEIPDFLKEKYKRLKGLFEFQRFVQIAKYLSPELETINISRNGKTSDADRLKHRSEFWSNYDSRFSSVNMWVSESDYKDMEIDKPVDLTNIKILNNIDNEACMLEFKESELLIIEFFRLRDGYDRIYSLIFEGEIIYKIKETLMNNDFTFDVYTQLKKHSTYRINQSFCWQGWLDKFLRDRKIYPNDLILEGKSRFKGSRSKYINNVGLQETREKALSENVEYKDVILQKKYNTDI